MGINAWVPVYQWWTFRASPSIELLREYVRSIEEQTEQGIADYRTKRVTPLPDDSGVEPPEGVTSYKGFDTERYHLDSVFERYFPSLQRTAALLTLYSFFESELNAVCDMVKKAGAYELAFSDLDGKGIDRARNYLHKVALIDTKGGEGRWLAVTTIQSLRNRFVHANGYLVGADKRLAEHVKASPYLEQESDLIEIKAGYLGYVLQTFEEYFQVLHKGFRTRRNKTY